MTTYPYLVDCRGAYADAPDREARDRFLKTIDTPGQIAEIDEETFYYFLEVLPPIFMNGRAVTDGRRYSFGFAEGAETIRGFWRLPVEGGEFRYYAENTGRMNPNAY